MPIPCGLSPFVGTATRSSRSFLRRSVPRLNETLPTASCARPETSSGLAAAHATAPQSCGTGVTALLAARGLLRALALRRRLRLGLRTRLRPLVSRHVWLLPIDLLPLTP